MTVATQRAMPSNWITMAVGWTFLILGLFSAFAPLGTSRLATIGSFAGPAGLVVFGWLALVPRVYSGVSVKGFVASMVAYGLLFLGTFALMQSQDTGKIIPLYAGMMALAYGAKKRDPMLRANARKLYGDPAAQALSSDTLFVYVVVLVLLLAVFTLRQQPVTVGLVGNAAQQLFDGLGRTGRGFNLLKSGLELLIGNFQIEYYGYCVAALFWLASDSTPHDRKIPPRAASWAILLTGVAILVMGILGLFRSNGVLSLMVGATIGSLVGATVMFIADRQLGIRSALTLTRRSNRAPIPAYASMPVSFPAAQSASATVAPTAQTPPAPATPQPQTPLRPGESPLPPYMQ